MRGTRVVGAVVVVLVVVGAGAVVADRVSAHRAQDRIAVAVEQNLDGVVGTPTVHVDGFPFLTQLAAGSLDDVSGSIEGATLGGIDARDVTFEGHDVSTSEPYTVGHATVSATLPTAALEKVVDARTGLTVHLAVAGDTLRASGTVLGLELSADVEPHVAGGKLTVDVERVAIGGVSVQPSSLPAGLGDRLTGIEIPVTGLPAGLALSSAEVVADGLRVTATGDDVELPTS